jgi:hypothetical protein
MRSLAIHAKSYDHTARDCTLGIRKSGSQLARRWEKTVRSFAKTVLGMGVIAMLGFCGAQPSGAAKVVLSDPLTSWPLNFGVQSDRIQMKDGALHIIETSAAANWATFSGFNFTDMEASLTIAPQVPTGNAAGLIFWATGPSDFFLVSIDDASGTFGVNRRISANGGSWQVLVPYEANAAVKSGAGAVNTIRIVTKGNSVALFINGQTIGTLAVLAPEGGGMVGIEGEGQEGKPADYIFSNISVSQ